MSILHQQYTKCTKCTKTACTIADMEGDIYNLRCRFKKCTIISNRGNQRLNDGIMVTVIVVTSPHIDRTD